VFPGAAVLILLLAAGGCSLSGSIDASDPFTREGASGQGAAGASGAEPLFELRGSVVGGEDEDPLRGVLVTLTDRDGREVAAARTDSAGVVGLGRMAPGEYVVRARHEAFKPLDERTEIRGLPPVRIQIQLAASDTDDRSSVRVTASRDLLDEVGFYSRRSRETGSFLVADEIRAANAPNTTELLATLPGFQVTVVGGARAAVGRRGCPPNVFLDGRPVGDTRRIDSVVSILGIGALEAYPGGSPPAEFAGFGQQCGAVVLWTRRG
jgi:hypothetical protein